MSEKSWFRQINPGSDKLFPVKGTQIPTAFDGV
jgi:hypothetical protein